MFGEVKSDWEVSLEVEFYFEEFLELFVFLLLCPFEGFHGLSYQFLHFLVVFDVDVEASADDGHRLLQVDFPHILDLEPNEHR